MGASLANRSADRTGRISAIEAIEAVARHWPEAHQEAVELLMELFAHFADEDPEVNGFFVSSFTHLKVHQALPLIEQAFAARRVDEIVVGDWEMVQAEWGVISSLVHFSSPLNPSALACLLVSA